MSLKNIHFILVRPHMGEYIGAAARAIKNFNITKLRIINPRCQWPNEKALATSVGAKDILKLSKANVLDSYNQKYHVYDHEFGDYIPSEQQRKKRGIFYAIIIGIVFIGSHYMAINYVDIEESASFYPPYVEKKVVYPELYKQNPVNNK